MSMSRKHYEAMAAEFGKAIADTREANPDQIKWVWHGINLAVDAFCRTAAADNPAFDAVRFRDAVYEAADAQHTVIIGETA